MGMRITTGMAMNTYRYNLQNSTSNVTKSRNTVISHRKFDSFGENPSSAIQAWRVRRAMVNNEIYTKNNSDTYTRFNIAWTTMGVVSGDLTDLTARKSDIYAINDATAAGRPALGRVLDQTAESIIQNMNSAKSGENFVFAGDDELNAPFTWNADCTVLYYRGVNVNAGGVKMPTEEPDWGNINEKTGLPANMPDKAKNAVEQAWMTYYLEAAQNPPRADLDDLNPQNWTTDPFANAADVDDYGTPVEAYKVMADPSADAASKAWAAYYIDKGDAKKLEAMAKETAPIDLGMGLLENDNGELVDGTYFDRSMPGINMLGFGVDEDGDPKNVCMIIKRLGEIYSNCNPDTGSLDKDDPTGTSEKALALKAEGNRLLNKLNAARDHVSGQHVDISARASFLQQNEERLDLQASYLNEQRAELEDVDLADAITAFSWDYYCYSAALKVGTQLLSQSLIDYMS